MKKLMMLLFAAILLTACSESEEPKVAIQEEVNEPAVTVDETEEVDEAEETATIDTSVFEYATNTEVTDAIDLNQHVTVFVDMKPETKPGMAFQHVLNQTYDFIQQDDVSGAKTIAINIRQDGKKIAAYTVDTDKFTPNDDEPMAQVVLDASVVDMAMPDVEAYAEAMDLKMNKE